jgi:hypothetical protein
MVTGEKPSSPEAIAVHDQATAANSAKAADIAKKITGVSSSDIAPDPAALSQALDAERSSSINNYKSLFDKSATAPGIMTKAIAGPDLGAAINARLAKSNASDLQTIMQLSPYDKVRSAVSDIKTIGYQGLTAPKIMELRSSLSNLAADATGKDAAAMSSVINGFDDHINNLISAGKWNGPSGSGVQFLSDYGNARQAYASHKSTYMDPSARNNSAIAAASKSLKDLEGPNRQNEFEE